MRSCGSAEIAHREPPRPLRVLAEGSIGGNHVVWGKLRRVEDGILAALGPEERGLVVGLALLRARGDALAGGAPQARAALQALGRERRVEALAALMREVAA